MGNKITSRGFAKPQHISGNTDATFMHWAVCISYLCLHLRFCTNRKWILRPAYKVSAPTHTQSPSGKTGRLIGSRNKRMNSRNYRKPWGGREASDFQNSKVMLHKMSVFQQKIMPSKHTHTHTRKIWSLQTKKKKRTAVNRNCAWGSSDIRLTRQKL